LSSPAPFGMRAREASITRMKGEEFDVFVIGGGITGAGIARDAALRGYKVALADKGDFAGATSSRSSKMVHGGLRYLQYYKFKLVFEALSERHTLSQIANNLVHPQSFLITVYRGASHGVGTYRLGLVLYDLLALFRTPHAHRSLGREGAIELEPLLKQEGLLGGFLYYDYRVDDARLTLANVKTAWLKGAAVANYVEVTGLDKEGGKVRGAWLADRLSGETFPIRAKVVVNATGPFTDMIRALDDPGCERKLRPTKGVHVVVSPERLPVRHAVVTEAEDGRNVFAVPWGRYVLIGTTDRDYEGDYDAVYATREDVMYLLDSVNRALPSANLSPQDVMTTYAGLRPLVLELGVKESEVSREHEIFVSPSGLFSIAGGKLTTYRSMAEELMDKVSDVLHYVHGVKAVFLSGSPFDLLDGAFDEKYRNAMLKDIAASRLDDDVAGHLLYFYGTRYNEVLALVQTDPSLASRIKEGHPYIWAEVRYACERDCAVHLEDILSRRLHLVFEDPEQGLDVAETAAEIAGAALGWSDETRRREVSAYASAVELTRRYRTG
jgi:glycerol-3-phosphate dehydrogenase